MKGCDGLSRIKPRKVRVNPLYPRHPRSINPYTDVNTAITCEEAESFLVSSFFYPVKMRLGSQVKRLTCDGRRGQEAFAELIFSQ
jgi:hypothetical protein